MVLVKSHWVGTAALGGVALKHHLINLTQISKNQSALATQCSLLQNFTYSYRSWPGSSPMSSDIIGLAWRWAWDFFRISLQFLVQPGLRIQT